MFIQRSGWLAAATLSLLLSSSNAQTITVDGETIKADESNVAPAANVSSATSEQSFDNVQLTEDVLANLTDIKLSNVSLFYFDDDSAVEKRAVGSKCKTMPGDLLYPSRIVWKVLDILSGGALIQTVPLGSACYDGEHYDEAKCKFLIDNWNKSDTHVVDPSSVMSPLYEGATCEPQGASLGKNCTLGAFPTYSLNITNVAQIQLAINFARNANLRLVVRNTGHDFLGKNTGEGALSLWTHHLNKIEVLRDYKSAGGRYKGPAFKVGAGVVVHELYEAAEREGFTAVGGECRTVGVAGGYAVGGGHSPVTPMHGLASDQILSVDIVTPDGRFITADETQNKDLFWALRGGGPATWGVVTSITVKVHEKTVFSGMTFVTTTKDMNITDDTFWKAIEAYWRRYPEFSAAKSYGYCRMSGLVGGGYAWRCLPFMVPGMKLTDFKKLVQPLLDEWTALGVDPKVEFFEHDGLYDAWTRHFPTSVVGNAYARTGSRLIPRKNWEDPELLNKTIQTVRSIVEDGAFLVHYNINADEPENTAESSVNPAWRDVMMFNIIGLIWDKDTPEAEVAALHDKLTNDLVQRMKDISPGSGAYLNEADVMDPEFGQSFFGSNYARLSQIKKKIDPKNVFWAPTAVGSENLYITGQEDYVTKQTGRLCYKN
ncbi:hypothetical protein BGZ61DRAFT_394241 [Ilyonectria robusta]|uniref:uncharacterized protein n=1 Tax=Ilyonectria robusta TaxID=1079257 RepID=UPI001E8E2145|nr:uncharacterized protein BGZ61DRAFT_394241 [Ilyonectria robusta]KAH8683925.1 hypothetical protein BGZ61DRAFT_394241 [Ilyonectria robusta]